MGLIYKTDDMIPLIKYNELDEFGARWQLQRYEDDDYTFQLKLLDIFVHPPNSTYSGLLFDILRKSNLYRAKVGFITHTSVDKTIHRLEITDTHLIVKDMQTDEEIISINLFYELPSVLKRETEYNKYDLVFHPLNNEYVLECVVPGTTDQFAIHFPTEINETEIIIDGTVTWRVQKLSSPRLLEDVVDKFNSIPGNPFNITLYSHLSNSYTDIYAPYILPTKSYELIENKTLFPGENKLDENIEINSEVFNIPNYFVKKIDNTVLYENEYTIDYKSGLLKIGNIKDEVNVSYVKHNESIDLIYCPVKLFTLNSDKSFNTFMLPIYYENEIIKEIDILTNQETDIVAYNYPTSKLKELNLEQQDRFQIIWNKDGYVYDLLSFNDTEISSTRCEVTNE